MSTELGYAVVLILAIVFVVVFFGNYNKSNVTENMKVLSQPRVHVNSYSDSAISQQNRNMHEPNQHPNSKCVSYRPHYDSKFSNCSHGCLNGYCNPYDVNKGSFQLYDHLDKEKEAMGLNHTHKITDCHNEFKMKPYHYVDEERNMMLPYAYFDGNGNGNKMSSKNPSPNMTEPNTSMQDSCINLDRMLESNNFNRVCVEADNVDLKNNAYSNEIHEHLDMDNDRSNLTNNIKPRKCTYSHIDTETSVLPLAHDDSYRKVSTIDGLDNIKNYIDASQADRLCDIHGPNTKNLLYVSANKMHNRLL